MLLRSSSTPVLGSLQPSFSESPNTNHHHSELHSSTQKHTQNSQHTKLSCSNQEFRKSVFHSPSMSEIKSTSRSSQTGFRRVQSEGNLEGLADDSYNVDEFSVSKKSARRNSCSILEPIPSFSHDDSGGSLEDDDDSEEEIDDEEEEYDEDLELGDTCYSMGVQNLPLEQVRNDVKDYGGMLFEGEGKMYLATGLGVSSIDYGDDGGSNGGGGGGYRSVAFNRDGGDNRGISMEQHYKRMLEENPGNPLFLRNYAQFLYQVKGDLGAAEEYYSRAILADPRDGEILAQYAKLIWDLHRDLERATSYFERAVEASSQDSNVHAAYANFLWDTECGKDEDEESTRVGQPFLLQEFMASATA